jgi:hypothetical protein
MLLAIEPAIVKHFKRKFMEVVNVFVLLTNADLIRRLQFSTQSFLYYLFIYFLSTKEHLAVYFIHGGFLPRKKINKLLFQLVVKL